MMSRKIRCVALASLLAAVPAAAGAFELRGAHVDDVRSSGITYVTSIPGAGGTDLEMFSRTLATYKAADGTMVTPETGPVERHFAMVGNQTTGAKIVDITDPTQPYVAGSLKQCTVGQGDIQIRHDALVAAIAYQTSGSCRNPSGKTLAKGSILVDLADPYDPIVAGNAPETQGSHNNTMHPSGDYLYISTSGKTPPTVPIYDIRDPYNPVLVKSWNLGSGDSPHDIRFSADGTRAYFAGIDQFRVVNTSDPANPSIISTFVAPGSTIGHDTLITPDKRFLFVGDELAGGGTAPCPGGAIYAYDLSNEAIPLLLGAAEAGVGPVTSRDLDGTGGATRIGGCTSHVMDLNPDKKSLTIGWYTAGTRIFDFSSFYNADGTPKSAGVIAASWGRFGTGLVEKAYVMPQDDGTNTWSAKQYHKLPCYVFSDDLALGFYVSKVTVPNAGCTPAP